MSVLSGKGMMIWKIKDCEGGNPLAIAQKAKDAGMTNVLIKLADRTWNYNLRKVTIGSKTIWVDDIAQPVVDALHALGIDVWGWHYVTGDNPVGEAQRAIARVNQLGLDGWVLDGEKEYKTRFLAAQTLANNIKTISVPLALSTYRFPTYHPDFPYKQFMEVCQIAMPQVYWQGVHNPAEQLERSYNEWQKYGGEFIPTGSAYKEHGWSATPADVSNFMAKAIEMGLEGVNLYSWDSAVTIAGMWSAIAAFDYGDPPIDPPPGVGIVDFVINHLHPWAVSMGYLGPVPVASGDNMIVVAARLGQAEAQIELNKGQIDLAKTGIAGLENDVAAHAGRLDAIEAKLPPDFVDFTIVGDNAPARFEKYKNGKGYPVLEIWPSDSAPTSDRIIYGPGAVVSVVPKLIKCDSGLYAYEIFNRTVEGHKLYLLNTEGQIEGMMALPAIQPDPQ